MQLKQADHRRGAATRGPMGTTVAYTKRAAAKAAVT
jgi:hypothetical protein